jgi:hypothetical protein
MERATKDCPITKLEIKNLVTRSLLATFNIFTSQKTMLFSYSYMKTSSRVFVYPPVTS